MECSVDGYCCCDDHVSMMQLPMTTTTIAVVGTVHRYRI